MVSDASNSISMTLLLSAKNRDTAAWSRLDTIFRPIVFAWFHRHWRLPPDAADDLVQNVMLRALGGLGGFQRSERGQSFTGWLWTIARNEVADYWFQKNREEVAAGGTQQQQKLAEVPETPPADDAQDSRLKLQRLLELVQRDFNYTTKIIFERVIVDGEPAADVAFDLGMKPSAVREAKRRVLQRLRDEWANLFGEWPFALSTESVS
jgi:RNA polymerase sigma-70 factor (ECF subfamily)